MAIGHNGGPLDRRLTDKEFRSLVRVIILSRLPGNQKLLSLGAVVMAGDNGEATIGAEDMKRICSVSKRDTVFAAKKAIAEDGIGIVSTVSSEGRANRYRIMPPEVVASIIESYNSRKEKEDELVPKNGTAPIPKKETSTRPEKGTTPVPKNGTSTRPENGDGPRARIETPSGLLFPDKTNTPLPPKGPTPLDALTAFNAYNETALRCGLPQAHKLTNDRQRKIIARLRDYGLDGWALALGNIEKSAFLTGGTDHCFRADLDFMCQTKSFGKLHDGGYGNGRHRAPNGSAADDPDARAAVADEWARARQITEVYDD
jgi:hypothetical protein